MINIYALLLFGLITAPPAFSAQHVAVHPRSGFDSPDQEIIRQIVDMERQSKRPASTATPIFPCEFSPMITSRLRLSVR